MAILPGLQTLRYRRCSRGRALTVCKRDRRVIILAADGHRLWPTRLHGKQTARSKLLVPSGRRNPLEQFLPRPASESCDPFGGGPCSRFYGSPDRMLSTSFVSCLLGRSSIAGPVAKDAMRHAIWNNKCLMTMKLRYKEFKNPRSVGKVKIKLDVIAI